MMNRLNIALLLCAAMGAPAYAAPFLMRCVPLLTTDGLTGSALELNVTKNGGWVAWTCRDAGGKWVEAPVYMGSQAQIKLARAELTKIIQAPAPLAAARAAVTRFNPTPLTDPALAPLVADWNAAHPTRRLP